MFDVLLDQRTAHRGRSRWTVPIALGVHVAAIGAGIAASYVAVQAISDPDFIILFPEYWGPPSATSVPAPPPPEGNTLKPVAASATRRVPSAPAAIEQPVTVQRITQADIDRQIEEAGGEDPDAAQTGDQYGQPWGERGGMGPVSTGPGSFLTGGGADTGPKEPLIVDGRVKRPELVQRVEPEYPETARRVHVEGIVYLSAIINEKGAVESVGVLKGNPLLAPAAVAAVERWRYRPATFEGQPVRVRFTVIVNFRLE